MRCLELIDWFDKNAKDDRYYLSVFPLSWQMRKPSPKMTFEAQVKSPLGLVDLLKAGILGYM